MNAEAVIAGLIQRGYPEHIAQGIAGNFAVESGFDPGINEIAPLVEGSRGGFGLAQWTGPRRVQYENFASERGSRLDDIDAQLDFLTWELGNTEKSAGAKLAKATNAEEAARIFSDSFLRPGIPHLDRRIAAARGFSQNPMSASPAPANALQAPQAPEQPQNALRAPQIVVNALDPRDFMTSTPARNRLAFT